MPGDEQKAEENKVTDRTQLSAPQDVVDTIWKNFTSHKPGFTRRLLKPSEDASGQGLSKETDDGSYNAARRACIEEVTSIVRECLRRNSMFTDPDFDILDDFKKERNERSCLLSLPTPKPGGGSSTSRNFRTPPKSIRRIHDIFDSPSFAPQAPRSCLPSIQHESTIRRWWTSSEKLVRRAEMVKSWLQATLFAACILRFFDFISLSTWFGSITLCGLSLAGCVATGEMGKRLLGPNFASCHVKQGYIGDCWWMSSVGALCSRNDLMRKVCVAWDQDCGVYGFVFYRDGAWFHTVVDDRLYLTKEDYYISEEGKATGDRFDERAKLYEALYQKGPDALEFASCGDSEYTWLPPLQKGYAKVHGDYEALVKGYSSEGMVDLTGGIAENLEIGDTQDQDRLWCELSRLDGEQLHTLATPDAGKEERKVGIALCHAYAIEKAYSFLQLDGWKLRRVRLLKIRNPWGRKSGLWQGDWGVGSRKWNPISMWWLNWQGNEDGVFYMRFEHALKTFELIMRTSIFDESIWTSQQQWVSMHVSWEPEFNPVYFELHLTKDSKTAFSVSQVDKRYFATLQGRYLFHLEFGVKKKGVQGSKFVAKSRPTKLNEDDPERCVSITTDLKSGVYEIVVKATAIERNGCDGAPWSAEDVLKQTKGRHFKLQQTARNYDQAYGKLKTIEPTTRELEEPEDPKMQGEPKKQEDSTMQDKAEELDKAEEPKKQEDRATVNDVDKFVYPDPSKVAWNAVCGVGLRVFSKDPAMRLEVHHRDDGKVSEPKKPAQAESAPKKEEEKTQEMWKVTIEGVARREKGDGSDTRNSRDVEDRGDKDGTASGDGKNDKDKSLQD